MVHEKGAVERVRIIKPTLMRKGLAYPKVLEAHYGDNPGKQGQEMYALQSGPVEASFEYMVAEDTVNMLRKFKTQQDEDGSPFFIWANFWGPHTPCFIPEPYYSMYDPASIPEEPSFGETWERKPFVQQMVERFWGLIRWRVGTLARDRRPLLGLCHDDR